MKRIFYALLTLVVVLSAMAILPVTASAVGTSIAKRTASAGYEGGRFEVRIQVPKENTSASNSTTTRENVVVTDYISKWMILDTTTIKVIDNNLGKSIWKSTDGWLITENRPTSQETPVVVEEIPIERYAEGGTKVLGNRSGSIYKVTWYVNDGTMHENSNYTLVYEATIDTQEPGFEYNANYPVNGNTTISYREKSGDEITKVIEDIPVPEVIMFKEETPPTTEATEPLPTETKPTTTKPTEPTKATEPTVPTKAPEETKATEPETEPTTKPTEPETIDIKGKVIWKDQKDKYGERPRSTTVNLVVNGIEVDYTIVTAEDDWRYAFENIRKYDAKGRKITYTITEDEVANYDTIIKGYNITNNFLGVKPQSTEPTETTEATTEPETESTIEETTQPEIQENINEEKEDTKKSSGTGIFIWILVIANIALIVTVIILIKNRR